MNLQNHFLVAMPGMQDPFFKKSVIYICEHSKTDGAMGITLTRTAEMTIKEMLTQIDITPEPRDMSKRLDKQVLAGGPIAPDRGFILHTPCDKFDSSLQLAPEVMITTSGDILHTLGTAAQPEHVLVAVGYAGWDKDQLEAEIKENAWLIVDADPDILFNTPISERWQTTAKKLGIDIRQIAPQAGHA
ncbi:YqgE/AlgH family protein [Plesiomonas sp.]|uniref:YqgE/AlgH family protein n=1 Tax=Plesiomonas sp. TaxID=2486279 RepID=UPI003F40E7FA